MPQELRWNRASTPVCKGGLDKIAAATQARNTFGAVAQEYLENLRERGSAETTIAKNKWLLQDLASPIAARPIAEITPAELLHLLKLVEKSGRRETARRLRGIMGTVFRYAVVTLRANGDPTFALQGALLPPNTNSRKPGVKMVLCMSRPWKHGKTGVYYFRKVVPDALRGLVGEVEMRRSRGTKTSHEAGPRAAGPLACAGAAPGAMRLAFALLMGSAIGRGGRAVEGARLESVYAGNRIAGSNPASSATD